MKAKPTTKTTAPGAKNTGRKDAKKSKKSTKEEEGLYLTWEEDGEIYVKDVDKNGKEVSKSHLERELVLQCVLYAVRNSLDFLEDTLEKVKTDEDI